MSEPSDKTIKRIENELRKDIRWAVRSGPGFDPFNGASYEREKKWTPSTVGCGVCAIGSLCLRRQPRMPSTVLGSFDDVGRAARLLRVPERWLNDLYTAVAHAADQASDKPTGHYRLPTRDYPPKCYALAQRLVSYADKLKAEKRAKLRRTKEAR